MTTKNYTYEDAVKANKTIKRDIIDLGYAHEGDVRYWDPAPFASDYYDGELIYSEDFDCIASEFLKGDLDTSDVYNSDLEDQLMRTHFEPCVGTTKADRQALEYFDGLKEIYRITIVDNDGDTVAMCYLVEPTTAYSSPEEALRNADDRNVSLPFLAEVEGKRVNREVRL